MVSLGSKQLSLGEVLWVVGHAGMSHYEQMSHAVGHLPISIVVYGDWYRKVPNVGI